MISNNPYLNYALGRLDVRGMVVITGNWTSKIAGHLARNLKKGWGSRRLPRTILPQSSLSMNSNVGICHPGKVMLLTHAVAREPMATGLEQGCKASWC